MRLQVVQGVCDAQSMMSSKCVSPLLLTRSCSMLAAQVVHSMFISTPGLRALELHHHDGAEVAPLVPVGVVVAGEPAEWSVRHLK